MSGQALVTERFNRMVAGNCHYYKGKGNQQILLIFWGHGDFVRRADWKGQNHGTMFSIFG